MQDFPHHYRTTAAARHDSHVEMTSPGLPDLRLAAPAEFGGPGDHWSPETLMAAAVASCFKLSFKAIARAAKFEWVSIRCDVVAVLDRVDKVTQFTEFHQTVVLEVPPGSDEAKALRLLEKAERSCLVTNSLIGTTRLDATVRLVG
jgi:organic hydroperoxide reductase OsmC/OhrA